jgi:hypothetical protein
MQDKRLNGWKEIGSYLGRTVRTAQRWEAQLEMPIHRPATRKRTAVIAFSRELDAWVARNRSRLVSYDIGESIDSPADIAALSEKLIRLQVEATQVTLEIRRARGETPQLLRTDSVNLANVGQRPD